MSEIADSAPAPKRSKLPLLLGLLLALAAAGGGFYGAFARLLPLPEGQAQHAPGERRPLPTFVPIDTVTINLGTGGERRHLRFTAQLDVQPAYRNEVQALMPRLVDILNSYLRALHPPELEDAGVINRLRSQLLRRMRMVTGPDRINDLLITEFVFN